MATKKDVEKTYAWLYDGERGEEGRRNLKTKSFFPQGTRTDKPKGAWGRKSVDRRMQGKY